MVRSLPTKSKNVWKNLLNPKKVHIALERLKEINPLYKNIILPANCNELLTDDMTKVEF